MNPHSHQDTPIRRLRKWCIDVRIHFAVLLRSGREDGSLTGTEVPIVMNLSVLEMKGLNIHAAVSICSGGAHPRQKMPVRYTAPSFHLGLDDFIDRSHERTGIAERGPLWGDGFYDRTRNVLITRLRGDRLAFVFREGSRIASRQTDEGKEEESNTFRDGKERWAAYFGRIKCHSRCRFAGTGDT